MIPIILTVTNDTEMLVKIKKGLGTNKYQTIPAKDGEKAFELLLQMEILPDLIISDLILPTLNGYDFYLKVAAKANLNNIPFLFLTNQSEPEDIRLKSKLSREDYLIKPFNDVDLVSVVKKKINTKVQKVPTLLALEKLIPSKTVPVEIVKELLHTSRSFFILAWNEIRGPELLESIMNEKEVPYSIEDVGEQLFNASIALYGHKWSSAAQGLLLRVENIQLDAYIYFDKLENIKIRGGYQQFMIGYITSTIPYLESLRIREICEDLAKQIKTESNWEMSEYWNRILSIHKE
jgi:CheY-like chemotaxis protein